LPQLAETNIVTEIAAFSPIHPEPGSISIDYDGFLIWERWARLPVATVQPESCH
jgi:hypothetical protein